MTTSRALFLLLPLLACSKSPAPAVDGGPDPDAGAVVDAGAVDAGPADAGPLRPAWLEGHAVHEWFAIPGTEGAGGAAASAYSGMALRPDTSELWIAAAGGHTDSSDNRVVSLDLKADAPKWVLRHAPSASVQDNVDYYADGTPASRHLYTSIEWVPSVHRLMLFGLRFGFPSAYTFPPVDGFDPDTNTWDPKGTWADAPSGHYGTVLDADGREWSTGLALWTPGINTWSQPIANQPVRTRFPAASDSKRRQLFTLMWADGQGYDTGLNASRVPIDGTVQLPVTFKAGAAVDAFTALQPAYAGMDYDPVDDRFYFYDGRTDPGALFVIAPADTGDWTMTTLQLGAGSAAVPATTGSGVLSRFRYVPALQGLVMLPAASEPLYFLRLH